MISQEAKIIQVIICLLYTRYFALEIPFSRYIMSAYEVFFFKVMSKLKYSRLFILPIYKSSYFL